MKYFSWLHLTDIHYGMKEQHWLWPGVKEIFFTDLQRLHDKCGPWDLVLFTGDLTQQGRIEEFRKSNEFFGQLWVLFDKLGFTPRLLAVPGNHDLLRPDRKDPAVRLIRQWPQEIQTEFWEDAGSPYRQAVAKAFTNYTAWWEKQVLKPKALRHGILPGDFSVTVEKDGAKLGLVGLNTAFLQLDSDDCEGKLALHARQFHEACDGDGPDWARQHHACLLLTHHPPAWLDPISRQHLKGEIVAHGRFAVHLCGHMHETVFQDIAEGGAETLRIWQGRSLFGLESFGQEKKREHGYTAGKIELREDKGTLLFWPRQARLQGGQRSIVPDFSIHLTDNQHTEQKEFKLLRLDSKDDRGGILESPHAKRKQTAAPGTKTASHTIFISYAAEDRRRVMPVVKILQQMNMDIRIDENKIPGAEEYGSDTASVIKEAHVFTLMCSNAAFNSKSVKNELKKAVKYGVANYLMVFLDNTKLPEHLLEWVEEGNELKNLLLFETEPKESVKKIKEILISFDMEIVEDSHPASSIQINEKQNKAVLTAELLPYMVNRKEQESELIMALDRLFEEYQHHPCLFLVHGEYDQCVDYFVHRVAKEFLPRTLKRSCLPDTLQWFHLTWFNKGPIDKRLRLLRYELTDKLDLRSTATDEEIYNAFVNIRLPIVLSYFVSAESWRTDEPELLKKWVDSWSGLPKLPVTQPLFILFSTKYLKLKERKNFIKSFLFRPRSSYKDKFIRTLKSLEQYEIEGIHVQTLPELDSITLNDVEDWGRTFIKPTNLERFMQSVRQIYEHHPHAQLRIKSQIKEKAIAMEPLTEELKKLLIKFSHIAVHKGR